MRTVSDRLDRINVLAARECTNLELDGAIDRAIALVEVVDLVNAIRREIGLIRAGMLETS